MLRQTRREQRKAVLTSQTKESCRYKAVLDVPLTSLHFSALTDRPSEALSTVTFEPGARTAWHTYPLGQTLIVTSGCGWAQREGGPVEEMHPGDVAWFSPGEKHWHGAAPKTAMTHITIQESLDGKAWTEKLWTGWSTVSEQQYRK